MSIPDEILAAYVDGELDPAACAKVEEAAHNDPRTAQRIDQYRALRSQLQAAYAAELEESVPDRLFAALRSSPPRAAPMVADLATARATKGRKPSSVTAAALRWRYSLAAGVLIALGVEFFAWRHTRPWLEAPDGTLVARGSLANGLSDQLSGEPAAGPPLRIGLSFVAKNGNYCRTFSLANDAGLACRRAGRWEILALAKQRSTESAASQFRTASSPFPAEILGAVEGQMSGEPLDRAGESAARDKRWNNAPR